MLLNYYINKDLVETCLSKIFYLKNFQKSNICQNFLIYLISLSR